MKLTQILVLDNNSHTSQIIEKKLENTRIIVTVCNTVEQAKVLVKNVFFDYVFIGDITDIEWLNDPQQYPHEDSNIYLYTQTKHILDEQNKKFRKGVYVPISNIYTILKDFLEKE
jgi:hypothetical protein